MVKQDVQVADSVEQGFAARRKVARVRITDCMRGTLRTGPAGESPVQEQCQGAILTGLDNLAAAGHPQPAAA